MRLSSLSLLWVPLLLLLLPTFGAEFGLKMTVPPLDSSSTDSASLLPSRTVKLDGGTVPISNDLFKGNCRAILKNHCGAYTFDNNAGGGGMDVLWEFQFQGKFLRPLRGPIFMALEIPGEEKEVRENLSWRAKDITLRQCRVCNFDVEIPRRGTFKISTNAPHPPVQGELCPSKDCQFSRKIRSIVGLRARSRLVRWRWRAPSHGQPPVPDL